MQPGHGARDGWKEWEGDMMDVFVLSMALSCLHDINTALTLQSYNSTSIYLDIYIQRSQLQQPAGLQSNTCVSYSTLRWTRVIQPCLFWERGLVCTEWDYRMARTEAEMGCQLRCVWSLVFLRLIHKRRITETPPSSASSSSLSFSSFMCFFSVFPQRVCQTESRAVWVWETIISSSSLFQPLIAQPMSMFSPTHRGRSAPTERREVISVSKTDKHALRELWIHLFSSHSQVYFFFNI